MKYRKTIGVLVCIAAGIIFFGILYPFGPGRHGNRARETETTIAVQQLERACRAYMSEYQRWPVSLSDLTQNPHGILFIADSDANTRDGWGNHIHYEPPGPTSPYARLVSLGKDGKVGGEGLNADREIKILLTENQDTNIERVGTPRSATGNPVLNKPREYQIHIQGQYSRVGAMN